MNILLAVILSYSYSPGDSSWSLITLGDIPDRAILFAELAAKEGGQPTVDLAIMLELAGRFSEAERIYSMAINSSTDPVMTDWLEDRMRGSSTLDTIVILSALITNMSDRDAADISVEIPNPESHPPYQQVERLAGVFEEDGNLLRQHINRIPPGTTVTLPLILHIKQEPFTFRPLSPIYQGLYSSVSLADISYLVRAIDLPEIEIGPGPCLETAYILRDRAAESDVELQIIGGLLRNGDDSLLFHAWNALTDTGMPLDAGLFHSDSLRGIGHCPTDIIPLWDFEHTDGHEVSIFYPQQNIQLDISMQASFADPDLIAGILKLFPMCFIKDI